MKLNERIKMKKSKYVVVRSRGAGVFVGLIVSKKDQSVVLKDARRLWYWKGASSLSQLAMEGVKCPKECKFPIPVDRVEIFEVLEILDMTVEAKKSIDGVPVWQQ